MGAVIGVAGCAGPAWELDRIDEGRATLIDPSSAVVRTVKVDELPEGAAEGDVVVDGRLDPELAAQLRAEVRRARARQRPSPLKSGGSLDDPAQAATTR